MFESIANNYFISIFDYNYFLCADLWLAKHPCAMRCENELLGCGWSELISNIYFRRG